MEELINYIPELGTLFVVGFAAGFTLAGTVAIVTAVVSMFRRVIGWTNIE